VHAQQIGKLLPTHSLTYSNFFDSVAYALFLAFRFTTHVE
jgi:hypothetical protein